jgi:hypothetical protein
MRKTVSGLGPWEFVLGGRAVLQMSLHLGDIHGIDLQGSWKKGELERMDQCS